MERGEQGVWQMQRVTGESFEAFVPFPLPPNPPIILSARLTDLLEKANRALGRLDGLALLLPDISLFLYFYVRKEAVLSSQIEGTQSSLSDLLLFESNEFPGIPLDEVREVSRYVAALEHGISRVREGFPLSSRLLREVHKHLLSKGRGNEREPGEFRRSQNWIGGTRPGNAFFVPPPAAEVASCLSALENFLHDVNGRTPTLIKAALAHVQFETIHPFLDGNGRVGRMLITLLLCEEKALQEPLLYLSYYLKQQRSRYYDLLTQVRLTGNWEDWLEFFLEGVQITADQAATTAQRILQQFKKDRQAITDTKRTVGSILQIHDALQRFPMLSVAQAAMQSKLSYGAANMALEHLVALGIVREPYGRQRNRLFYYEAYLNLLDDGTVPPP